MNGIAELFTAISQGFQEIGIGMSLFILFLIGFMALLTFILRENNKIAKELTNAEKRYDAIRDERLFNHIENISEAIVELKKDYHSLSTKVASIDIEDMRSRNLEMHNRMVQLEGKLEILLEYLPAIFNLANNSGDEG